MGLKDTLRIMVVDDMSVSRGLLVQSLEEMGLWKNETEASGPAALARLTARPCHLVLCDYNMPGMDGLGLLHALRSHRATQGIGFILVTGTPTPQMLEKGRALRLNNLVKKPFTTPSLRQAIESVVGRL